VAGVLDTVPVPRELADPGGALVGGVTGRGGLVGGVPCWPAWLVPPLACVEIAAPLSTPVDEVVCARADTCGPCPRVDDGGVEMDVVGVEVVRGTSPSGLVIGGFGCVTTWLSGADTLIPILLSMSDATR
jgi:hypothetical protein